MDLVREILLTVEESPAGTVWAARPFLEHSLEEVVEHIRLLMDAEYVDATTLQHKAGMVRRITNAGHEFLDSSRDKSLWEKRKSRLRVSERPQL